jgi:hypothetical protein
MSATHKYVAVLGSCCTGDAVGAATFEVISAARLRLLLFQGRTSFLSLASAGLSPEEFDVSEDAADLRLDWGARMAADEAAKRHLDRLGEIIGITDALIVDHVSAFVFPLLVDRLGRCFVKSWEWERFIRPHVALDEQRLWQVPLARSVEAQREVLGRLYALQPNLAVVFHLPWPRFNDGVAFTDPAVAAHLDFYEAYGAALADDARRQFPRVSVFSPETGRADRHHQNGPHPFRFDREYLETARRELESILGVVRNS